jgi:hypothetical protein
MRAIKYTNRFKRDYRREKFGVLGKKLDTLLMDAVNLLAADKPARFGRLRSLDGNPRSWLPLWYGPPSVTV